MSFSCLESPGPRLAPFLGLEQLEAARFPLADRRSGRCVIHSKPSFRRALQATKLEESLRETANEKASRVFPVLQKSVS